ncbi:MAG: leucyl aminopeptidase [Nitrospiraceae bacterium]|nr:leucyl aminopeptidase [Nitrospiraceae bacterium]
MKVLSKDINEPDCECGALVLPCFEGEGIKFYEDIDRALDGVPSGIFESGEFRAKADGKSYVVQTFGKIKPARLLLLGLGKRDAFGRDRLRQAGGRAASALKGLGIKEGAVSTRLMADADLDPADFVEGALLSQYRFGAYRKEENGGRELEGLTVLTKEDLEARIGRAGIIAGAVKFARDLVNTPANDMTPLVLARTAMQFAGESVKVTVIEKDEAEKLGMGAYLSVARGSLEPPMFIVLSYLPVKDSAPVALIGKSITFDSGGISLKPSDGMEKMKYDMAGGAAVLGVIKAASEMKMPVNIIAVLPATENLPGGHATRPGDVARTVEGKTVEIINTDAEGRLVLADAIGYSKRFNPKAMVDIATLTGACSIALGNEAIAMMGNDEQLIGRMKAASDETAERVWQMPLYEEYGEYIKSDIADLKNTGGRSGSLVTAAYFLKEFAGKTPWVHLDIASTAWTDKDKPYIPKGATGIGVRLLLEFVRGVFAL